jgi:hypothetical protein
MNLMSTIYTEIIKVDPVNEVIDKQGGRSGGLSGKRGQMSLYTTPFLKIFVKTL